MEKIEKAFNSLVKISEFTDKYRELINSFSELRKEAGKNAIIINSVSLPLYWTDKYPDLKKDMEKSGLKEKLLGLKIK